MVLTFLTSAVSLKCSVEPMQEREPLPTIVLPKGYFDLRQWVDGSVVITLNPDTQGTQFESTTGHRQCNFSFSKLWG